jgi:hypothetical protein
MIRRGINYVRSAALAAVIGTVAIGVAHAADVPIKAPPKPPAPPPFFIVNDNSLSTSYQFNATNPGAGFTPKWVESFTHFDVWQYGTNFFNVDLLQATNHNAPFPAANPGTPAAPCDLTGTSNCAAYTEIYGFFRSTLGLNQLTHSTTFAGGPLTNVELAWGADANVDNTTLGSAKKSIQAGLQFDFAAPYHGFINVGTYAYKEWQHDGFASTFGPFAAGGCANPLTNCSGNVNFNTTWAVEVLYKQPLGFLPDYVPVTFTSLAVVHGPKGCGEPCNTALAATSGPGLVRTTEYLTQQMLSFDVGKPILGRTNMFSVWVAYRYWANKFGIAPGQPNGFFCCTVESTMIVGSTVAF